MSDRRTMPEANASPAGKAANAVSVSPVSLEPATADSTSSTLDMVVTRVFDAEVEQVWSAWTTPEGMKQWWGPRGFTCPVARMDLRVGGVSLLCMRAPKEFGGQDYYNTWTYTKVVPNQRLEFDSHFTDKDGNRIEPASIGLPADLPIEVRQVVTFRPTGDGRTELTVSEYGYRTAQTVELSRMGLNQCLDKMAESFAKR